MKSAWLSWLLAAVAMALTLPDLIFPFYPAHPPPLADNMQDTGAESVAAHLQPQTPQLKLELGRLPPNCYFAA